ncbi:hypothetical protein PPRY_b0233 [Pseudoalteromonas prydzensis ACAM 620]|nr:hypothetical protein [Pseudoalteromonas prydzensis ACAM 620]
MAPNTPTIIQVTVAYMSASLNVAVVKSVFRKLISSTKATQIIVAAGIRKAPITRSLKINNERAANTNCTTPIQIIGKASSLKVIFQFIINTPYQIPTLGKQQLLKWR